MLMKTKNDDVGRHFLFSHWKFPFTYLIEIIVRFRSLAFKKIIGESIEFKIKCKKKKKINLKTSKNKSTSNFTFRFFLFEFDK